MDFNIIWNELCFGIKEERNKKEEYFQIFIEGIFGRLGWSLSGKEILSRGKIQEGKMPDITIAENGKHKYFVVELKKPGESLNKHINQLLGYMRLLKLSIGILLADSLRIYYKLPDNNDQFCKIIDFPLEENYSEEGIKLLSLICKNNFSLDNLTKYCEDRRRDENIIREGESNEHENETSLDRLYKISAYLRDKNNKREGKRFETRDPRNDSLIYDVNNKGFEITIKSNESKIKLWDISKPEEWYKKNVDKIKELLSKPKFEIDSENIYYRRNQGKKSNRYGFYILLDNFREPNKNPATPENILKILEAVDEVMEWKKIDEYR